MPTLFRFLMVLGVIGGVIAGSLYVLAEYFQPEPKEISKALRNVKGRIEETTASTRPLSISFDDLLTVVLSAEAAPGEFKENFNLLFSRAPFICIKSLVPF